MDDINDFDDFAKKMSAHLEEGITRFGPDAYALVIASEVSMVAVMAGMGLDTPIGKLGAMFLEAYEKEHGRIPGYDEAVTAMHSRAN